MKQRVTKKSSGVWQILLLALPLSYVAVTGGATYPALQLPLVVWAIAAFVVLVAKRTNVLGDAIFWFGGLFLALLAMQWWNAGRAMMFDSATGVWTYSAPQHPGLPSAITRAESAEMLCWFFPALLFALVAGTSFISPVAMNRGLRIAIFAGAIAALVGIIADGGMPSAELAGPHIPNRGFAGFGYANHALRLC